MSRAFSYTLYRVVMSYLIRASRLNDTDCADGRHPPSAVSNRTSHGSRVSVISLS